MTGRVRHTIGHFVRAGFGGVDLARGFNLGVEQAVGGLGGMGTRLEVFLSLEHIGVFGSVEADDDLAGALARGFNLGVEQAVGGLGGMGTRLEVFLSLEHIGVFGSVEADDDLAGAAGGIPLP